MSGHTLPVTSAHLDRSRGYEDDARTQPPSARELLDEDDDPADGAAIDSYKAPDVLSGGGPDDGPLSDGRVDGRRGWEAGRNVAVDSPRPALCPAVTVRDVDNSSSYVGGLDRSDPGHGGCCAILRNGKQSRHRIEGLLVRPAGGQSAGVRMNGRRSGVPDRAVQPGSRMGAKWEQGAVGRRREKQRSDDHLRG
jgi:hypothetical protein